MSHRPEVPALDGGRARFEYGRRGAGIRANVAAVPEGEGAAGARHTLWGHGPETKNPAAEVAAGASEWRARRESNPKPSDP